MKSSQKISNNVFSLSLDILSVETRLNSSQVLKEVSFKYKNGKIYKVIINKRFTFSHIKARTQSIRVYLIQFSLECVRSERAKPVKTKLVSKRSRISVADYLFGSEIRLKNMEKYVWEFSKLIFKRDTETHILSHKFFVKFVLF